MPDFKLAFVVGVFLLLLEDCIELVFKLKRHCGSFGTFTYVSVMHCMRCKHCKGDGFYTGG
jgi:hypothetical protein